jgi:hypothetical protein
MKAPPMMYGQKETLHTVSFYMGNKWNGLSDEFQERVLNSLGGSAGVTELACLWADEFGTQYDQAFSEDLDNNGYIEIIDAFLDDKWDKFVAHYVRERMTEGAGE